MVLSALPLRAGEVPQTAAERARSGPHREASFSLGPFFTYRRARVPGLPPGVDALRSYVAVRPFYAHVRDGGTGLVERDFLWPFATSHARADESWWRVLWAYGRSRQAPETSWSFDVLPILFFGQTRERTSYAGFFPFCGTHPHFLFMDDWSFALWPLYHTYTVKGVRSRAILWPFFSWKDHPRRSVAVWPFWGLATQYESKHAYVLWPFATWSAYAEERETAGRGHAWMFWPFYGRVRRMRETQDLVLPPFFSYAATPRATRLRAPWPFVDIAHTPHRTRHSFFPFYERVTAYASRTQHVQESTWRVGWKLVESTTLTSARTREEIFSFFPFFTRQRLHDAQGRERLDYLRIWPFYARMRQEGRTASRALELVPVRHNEGIARNWAPFWTLWTSETRPNGRTRHTLLWKIFSWHGDSCTNNERK